MTKFLVEIETFILLLLERLVPLLCKLGDRLPFLALLVLYVSYTMRGACLIVVLMIITAVEHFLIRGQPLWLCLTVMMLSIPTMLVIIHLHLCHEIKHEKFRWIALGLIAIVLIAGLMLEEVPKLVPAYLQQQIPAKGLAPQADRPSESQIKSTLVGHSGS